MLNICCAKDVPAGSGLRSERVASPLRILPLRLCTTQIAHVDITSPRSKVVGRNFSTGGLSGAPGEGSPAIFQFQGVWGLGVSTPSFSRFSCQNERISLPGAAEHAPLPMSACAYGFKLSQSAKPR